MFDHLNTYRKFLLGLLIMSYSFNVFHKPVFEVLHLVYHIPGIVLSSVKVHSFESHDNEVHRHGTLAKLEMQTSDQDKSSPIKNIQEVKKKIEIVEKTTASTLEDTSVIFNNFQVILPFKSALKKINSPPPQRFS